MSLSYAAAKAGTWKRNATQNKGTSWHLKATLVPPIQQVCCCYSTPALAPPGILKPELRTDTQQVSNSPPPPFLSPTLADPSPLRPSRASAAVRATIPPRRLRRGFVLPSLTTVCDFCGFAWWARWCLLRSLDALVEDYA